jgi:hypothetical protein
MSITTCYTAALLSYYYQALLELPHPIVGVLPGAETGVELADVLAARLGESLFVVQVLDVVVHIITTQQQHRKARGTAF